MIPNVEIIRQAIMDRIPSKVGMDFTENKFCKGSIVKYCCLFIWIFLFLKA